VPAGRPDLTQTPQIQTRYDLVVCDEVQDFADIQLALIFSLVPSPANVVLTGDPKQIINPSGFRWEEVRNKFYERGVAVPEVRQLSLNFRCVGSIVRLANALLDLKRQLVGLSAPNSGKSGSSAGGPRFSCPGCPSRTFWNRLQLKGAGRILLVRDRREQKKLKTASAASWCSPSTRPRALNSRPCSSGNFPREAARAICGGPSGKAANSTAAASPRAARAQPALCGGDPGPQRPDHLRCGGGYLGPPAF